MLTNRRGTSRPAATEVRYQPWITPPLSATALNAAVLEDGSAIHVSVSQSETHALQTNRPNEIVVDGRPAAEAVGVSFAPMATGSTSWSI
jgi:hypothetical protein